MKSRLSISLALVALSVFVFAYFADSSIVAQQAPAQLWAVEGPISAVDPTAGTITCVGVTYQVGADIPIAGTAGPITGATLDLLLDDATTKKSILGGTSIADGFVDDLGNYVAENVFIELSENILLGMGTFDTSGQCHINGVKINLNPDDRFPGDFHDVGGDPIGAEVDLAFELGNSDMAAEGYFHEGEFYALLVETSYIPVNNVTDTVRIARARGRNKGDRSELNLNGIQFPWAAGTTVTISANGVNLGSTNVVLDVDEQGAWSFRTRNLQSAPNTVTVTSSGGGSHTTEVNIR